LIYFDTTYIVRIYFQDPGWDKVRQFARTGQIASATLARAETIAAFHRKFREAAITQAALSALIEQFEMDAVSGAFQWLPISNAILQSVAGVYGKLPASIALRAADALHLACAAENGCKDIYSNDARLLAAAVHFGINGVNFI
jgi:predicted nucleic acid-binding protein